LNSSRILLAPRWPRILKLSGEDDAALHYGMNDDAQTTAKQ
jgi:hypothetical protein